MMPRIHALARAVAWLAAAVPPLAHAADVTIQRFAFRPSALTIVSGVTVRWTNLDSTEHTVTSQTGPGTLIPSGVFDSNLLGLNQTFDFTFATPGDYDYFCIPHGSSMQGVIHVLPRCVADIDDGTGTGTPDSGVTIDDLLYYLNQYVQGTTRADLDDGSGTGVPDGGVTIDDLLYFLARYSEGC